MTPIPRDQLLQKLDDGWIVRRKGWHDETPSATKFNIQYRCGIMGLLEDDWEGEPPGPQLKQRCLNIIGAFEAKKRGDAAFVRRESWEEGAYFVDMINPRNILAEEFNRFAFSVEDILAKDWEVWK